MMKFVCEKFNRLKFFKDCFVPHQTSYIVPQVYSFTIRHINLFDFSILFTRRFCFSHMHRDSFLSLAAFAVLSFSSFTATTAHASAAAAAGGIQYAAPAPTPAVVEIRGEQNRARQAQVPFQFCPEMLGKAKKKCPDCGGDTKIKGYCDTVCI
jgi:hypothetical protein